MTSGIGSEQGSSTSSQFVETIFEIASRHSLSSLEPLLQVCRAAITREDLSVAVLGRFKAGKSSFLNHFLQRAALPVGVLPVTSVVTEIAWGAEEGAEIRFLDGRRQSVRIDEVGGFITEAQNPANQKRVSGVLLSLPSLETYRGLRFIDTPGLESVIAHNTETSLAWIPNVDLALVAIGVDPPLAQQDVQLIRKLFEFTPKVCVLLTKIDLLSEKELAEVLSFMREQLNRNFATPIAVFPYSTKPGFEPRKSDLECQFIGPALESAYEQKQLIAARKLLTLARESADYLQVALRSTQIIGAEKAKLLSRARKERATLADTKLELQLVARHGIGAARPWIETLLRPHERRLEIQLANALEREYEAWRMPFAALLNQFDDWLRRAMIAELSAVSASNKAEFIAPMRDVQRQYLRILQAFRDRLSEQTMDLLGVPLRTAETEIEIDLPKAPDVNIGRIFDHNWELLSPLLPMTLLRGPVKRRFERKVAEETFKNIARLTAQWTDILTSAISQVQKEAERRLVNLVETIERLIEPSSLAASEIEADLSCLHHIQSELQAIQYKAAIHCRDGKDLS